MITKPAKFNTALQEALPLPVTGSHPIDQALRHLAEIIDRDPSARAIVDARRARRGHGGSRASAGCR